MSESSQTNPEIKYFLEFQYESDEWAKLPLSYDPRHFSLANVLDSWTCRADPNLNDRRRVRVEITYSLE